MIRVRRRNQGSASSAFFVALLLVCAPAAHASDVLSAVAAQHLPAGAVSYTVLDAGSGQVILSHNADTPRSPASTIKILTTIASLDELGPGFTWQTRALVSGNLKNGVLDGDLVLQGGGDPYMTLERWWSFAHLLRAHGLRTIQGNIIVDNTRFAVSGENAGDFDRRPNRAYNVLPDALMVNFQSIEFTLSANPETRRVEIGADPAPVNLTIDNRVRYAAGRCSGAARRVDFEVVTPQWDRVLFTGTLSGHCAPRSFTRVLLTPADYAYGTFAELWRQLGGEIGGKLRVAAAPDGARLLLSFDSLTLGEIVRLTNKYSSNLLARHLLLTLGANRFGAPATVGKGAAAIADWSRTKGLSLDDVEIDNGSGLSRATHVSVAEMARVLSAAYHSPYAPEFVASLPLAGVDGTLRSRMKGSPAGAVRLKTGHLDGVSGIAGFVTAGDGRTYIVVCLINHPRTDAGAGDPVNAALVEWVLERRAPSPTVSE
jgi:D-alanyl-D-alanine carboxypeptidase/D-alanyl-D-alanine-endopeptidase (penicillin-binding protein 4)